MHATDGSMCEAAELLHGVHECGNTVQMGSNELLCRLQRLEHRLGVLERGAVVGGLAERLGRLEVVAANLSESTDRLEDLACRDSLDMWLADADGAGGRNGRHAAEAVPVEAAPSAEAVELDEEMQCEVVHGQAAADAGAGPNGAIHCELIGATVGCGAAAVTSAVMSAVDQPALATEPPAGVAEVSAAKVAEPAAAVVKTAELSGMAMTFEGIGECITEELPGLASSVVAGFIRQRWADVGEDEPEPIVMSVGTSMVPHSQAKREKRARKQRKIVAAGRAADEAAVVAGLLVQDPKVAMRAASKASVDVLSDEGAILNVAGLDEYLKHALADAGYVGVEVYATAWRTEVIIRTMRVKAIFGDRCSRIRALEAAVQKDFELTNVVVFPEQA
jgi:hypothetical protein